MRNYLSSAYTGAALALLAFLAMIIFYSPVLAPQDLDYDEGINLMKALLFQNGYPLYTEIWSDQPPLLTLALAGWFQLFGASALAGRTLILLFAAALVLALHDATRHSLGPIAALGALWLLLVSQEFIRLSSSVMIGLPSLCAAMVAIWLLLRYRTTGRNVLLVASAVVLGGAAQIKLLAAVAAPTALLYLLITEATRPHTLRLSGRSLHHAFWWLAVAGSTYLAIGLYFGALRVDQLLAPHFDAETRNAYTYTNNVLYLQNAAQRHAPYLALGLLGALWAARRRRVDIVLPLGWFIAAVGALAIHRPLWHHHITLFTIPLCWLGAYGLQAAVEAVQTTLRTAYQSGRARLANYSVALLAAAALFATLLHPAPIHALLEQETNSNFPTYQAQLVERLRSDLNAQGGMVFTDHPFYAFQAQALTPPETAVLSRKRLQSGALTDQMLVDMLEKRRPQYVILERFTAIYGAGFLGKIHAEYELSLETETAHYFTRHD